jgi:exoribonuclease R
MVHRQLIAILNSKKSGQPLKIDVNNDAKLKQQLYRCNKQKIVAKKISTACEKV